MDISSIRALVQRLENSRGHGLLIKGISAMKVRKVIPMNEPPDRRGVVGTVSLFVDGYRVDFEVTEAHDLQIVSKDGAVIA